MSGRLPTGIAVGALLRRVNDAGGMAMVRARGDAEAGGVVVLIDEGSVLRAVERFAGPDGRPVIVETKCVEWPAESLEEYWRRRRDGDPDLWVIELDIPEAERFIAETLLVD